MEQINTDNLRWDSYPAFTFQPSLSKQEGKLLNSLLALLFQVEVSMEHLAAIQFQQLVHGPVVKLHAADDALH